MKYTLDAPARGYRLVNGAGGRPKRIGAKQVKKLLLLREALAKQIQGYADEAGLFFNHAIDILCTAGLRCVQLAKQKRRMEQ